MSKKYILILFSACFCFLLTAIEKDNLIESELEHQIDAWMKSIAKDQKKISIYSAPQIKNLYFKKIVNMGPPILPLLINKISERNRGGRLGLLVSTISKANIFSYFDKQKKIYIFPDYPDFSYVPLAFRKDKRKFVNIWIYWWTEGRSKTPELFKKKYKEWKIAKGKNNFNKTKNKFLEIQDLGIVALPEIISTINAGEKDFIPIFSFLVDKKVPTTASVEECNKWWKSNKNKYKKVLAYPKIK